MKLLSFKKTKELLEKYKIPVVETRLVKTKKEAKEAARKIGYPVVLKIASPEVLHRTERGLVKIGIENEKELAKAFDELMSNSSRTVLGPLRVEGILVQKMAKGIEMACGMKRDASFGPVLMFGLGGIFVEVLKEVSFQIAPVSEKEAREMIKKYTGRTRVNLEKLCHILIQLSKLSMENPEIKEIDLNPIFVDEKEARAADFKFIT